MKKVNTTKRKLGILVMNYTREKVRKILQSDDNLRDCHNEDNWIEGQTKVKGLPYLEITLQSNDKLRVYTPTPNGGGKRHKVQFRSENRWSVKVKGCYSLQESKDKIFRWYNKS